MWRKISATAKHESFSLIMFLLSKASTAFEFYWQLKDVNGAEFVELDWNLCIRGGESPKVVVHICTWDVLNGVYQLQSFIGLIWGSGKIYRDFQWFDQVTAKLIGDISYYQGLGYKMVVLRWNYLLCSLTYTDQHVKFLQHYNDVSMETVERLWPEYVHIHIRLSAHSISYSFTFV